MEKISVFSRSFWPGPKISDVTGTRQSFPFIYGIHLSQGSVAGFSRFSSNLGRVFDEMPPIEDPAACGRKIPAALFRIEIYHFRIGTDYTLFGLKPISNDNVLR
jgi:hypothetical protein